MRAAGQLIVAISLALALVAASGAYLVDLERHAPSLAEIRVDRDGEELGPLRLAETIKVAGEGRKQRTVAEAGDALTAATLERLAEEGVRRARVRDFAWSRWEQRWLFLLGLVGLGAGAFLTRRAAALALTAAPAAGTIVRSPDEELAAIRAIVDGLVAEWPSDPVAERYGARVLARLDVAIGDHGPALVAQRERLVARLGLGGYAGLMDRFAAAERQIHRAWSSAADGILEETRVCLGRARVILAEASEALGAPEGAERP